MTSPIHLAFRNEYQDTLKSSMENTGETIRDSLGNEFAILGSRLPRPNQRGAKVTKGSHPRMRFLQESSRGLPKKKEVIAVEPQADLPDVNKMREEPNKMCYNELRMKEIVTSSIQNKEPMQQIHDRKISAHNNDVYHVRNRAFMQTGGHENQEFNKNTLQDVEETHERQQPKVEYKEDHSQNTRSLIANIETEQKFNHPKIKQFFKRMPKVTINKRIVPTFNPQSQSVLHKKTTSSTRSEKTQPLKTSSTNEDFERAVVKNQIRSSNFDHDHQKIHRKENFSNTVGEDEMYVKQRVSPDPNHLRNHYKQQDISHQMTGHTDFVKVNKTHDAPSTREKFLPTILKPQGVNENVSKILGEQNTKLSNEEYMQQRAIPKDADLEEVVKKMMNSRKMENVSEDQHQQQLLSSKSEVTEEAEKRSSTVKGTIQESKKSIVEMKKSTINPIQVAEHEFQQSIKGVFEKNKSDPKNKILQFDSKNVLQGDKVNAKITIGHDDHVQTKHKVSADSGLPHAKQDSPELNTSFTKEREGVLLNKDSGPDDFKAIDAKVRQGNDKTTETKRISPDRNVEVPNNRDQEIIEIDTSDAVEVTRDYADYKVSYMQIKKSLSSKRS